MKNKLVLALGLSLILSGCGDSNNDFGLGDQIDGAGRPAVNTALINTFSSNDIRSAAQDEFNQADNSARSRYAGTMADQLAIYDALVGTCGDNPLSNRASANPADGLASGANRYGFIASVFADDQLYLNANSGGSEAGQCNQYLSAELGVIGVTGLETDCGGRTPVQDVIATTYSAVSIGAVAGVDDGIATDNVTHSATDFPFIAAPR